MSGIENGLLELGDASRDDWAFDVVVAATWYHSERVGCRGFTMTHAGRGFCGNCGWQVSARNVDRGKLRSAQFSLLALGRIGHAFAIAQHFAEVFVGYQFADHRDKISDVQLDGAGGITYRIDLGDALKSVSFTHQVDL